MIRIRKTTISGGPNMECADGSRCPNLDIPGSDGFCPFIIIETDFPDSAARGLKLEKIPAWRESGWGRGDNEITVVEVCERAQADPRVIAALGSFLSEVAPASMLVGEELRVAQEVEAVMSGEVNDYGQVTTNQGNRALEVWTSGEEVLPEPQLAIVAGRLIVVNTYDLGETATRLDE